MTGRRRKPDPRSGLDPETHEWRPVFDGQRPPFNEGHRLSVGNKGPTSHGSYAVLQLAPRAEEIAAAVRGLGSHLTPADEPAVQLCALLLAQVERAARTLGEVDEAIERGGEGVDAWLGRVERRGRLSQDARGWAKEVRNLLDRLGLTPAGRAALEERQLTVVHVHQVQLVLDAWRKVTSQYVPVKRRAEFLLAFAAAMREAGIELPTERELPPARTDTDELPPAGGDVDG
jgi:hypothetical protein